MLLPALLSLVSLLNLMSGGLRVVGPDGLDASCFEPVEPRAREQALEIVTDVKARGEAALLHHAHRLRDLGEGDDVYLMNKEEIKAVYDALDEDLQQLLQRTASRIRLFAEAQRSSVSPVDIAIEGGRAGQTVEPVRTAGCYAPGGRYPLPSSVLMTAVTARTAGVERVVVASPRPSPVTVAAAHVAGADCLLKVGGAQAVAAMAYGIGDSVPPCDIIVGPGNKWVTAAKSIVSGVCGIDMLAGPSEVLVIADGTCDPEVVAADLLAQAEHDVEARPILVTADSKVIEDVNSALVKQLEVLTTKDVAQEAVKKGFAVLVADIDEAIKVSDRLAPEHLEIQTSDSQAVADRCNSYGGLFIGTRAAEVLGDYGAGPNHVLPTGGTGKYTGGLSVHTFLRLRTWMRLDDADASQAQVKDSVQLARLEGLEGHARAAEKRLVGDGANGHAPPAKKQKA